MQKDKPLLIGEEESKGLEKGKEEKKDEVKKEVINRDQLEKMRKIDHFFFAVAKQHVSIVNKVTGQEYMIIKQRAINENDRISGAFLTYY